MPDLCRPGRPQLAAVHHPGRPGVGLPFDAVPAESPEDVWLTGDAGDAGILTEHWDGSTRRTVSAPVQPNNGAGLLGVATVSPTNAWGVGWATADDECGEFTGLLDHWDGTAWKAVPLPA
ncbi:MULTISPECIES: hypothetical protein [unclassified Streptomyces]|uniref:hypothetical protein n=1 Tax=unclassified Streptomyces TaxID=2593676 RepID=UPI003D936811